ncbi:MAG: tetratricopeptide repeat protein [Oscillibacter sp.]|nr:tetratricopeptide repeat protein [Oscillibacter sp.]
MKRAKKIICVLLAAVLLAVQCGCSAEARWRKRYDTGVRYMSEGNYQEAILAFRAAIEIDPRNADAYRMLAALYTRQGNPEAAAEVLADGEAQTGSPALSERLEELRRGASQEQYANGLRAAADGDDGAAAAAFQAAIAWNQENIESYQALAELYVRQGDYDAAAEVLKQGAEATGNQTLRTLLERVQSLVSLDLDALVTDAYRYTGYSNGEELNYRIPRINLDGLETINQQIYDDMYSPSELADLFSLYGGLSASYEWTVYRGILSLVVEELFGSGVFIENRTYKVYNISLLTREAVPAEDVVSVTGMTMAQYQRRARECLGAEFWGGNREAGIEYYRGYSYNEEWRAMQMLNQNLVATISPENVQYHARPYVAADGDLWMVGTVYDGYHSYDVPCNVSGSPALLDYDRLVEDAVPETGVSRTEAYRIACEHWDYTSGDLFYSDAGDGTSIAYRVNIEDTGFLRDKDSGRPYYTFSRVCWGVDDGRLYYNGEAWVDAQTGECLDAPA